MRTKNLKAISRYLRNIIKNVVYSKANVTNSYEEIFKKFVKAKEPDKEIFKTIETLLKDFKGDCDDFATLLSYKALKEGKQVKILMFINKSGYAYHTAVIINGYIFDIWKYKKVFKADVPELLKDYKKAIKINVYEIEYKYSEVSK